MKTLFSFFLLSFFLFTNARSQDCAGVTLKPGMTFEEQTFMKNDQLLSTATYRVKAVRREGGKTIVEMEVQTVDAFEKTKNAPVVAARYTCTGNTIQVDLSGMAQNMKDEDMPDMVVSMKTNNIVFPGKLSVGQAIPDGIMQIEMTNAGKPHGSMDMRMTNRKVTGREAVKTPVGTFDAYKVTADMVMNIQMGAIKNRMTMQRVDYRVPGQLLDVRTETYRGKSLITYTLLSKGN